MIVDLTSSIELDVFDEVFAQRIYPVDRVTFQPGLIIDCGANVGYFAALCRARWPKARVVCFEPQPENFLRLLAQPILRSGSNLCIEAAVSMCDGRVPFSGHGAGGTITQAGGPDVSYVSAISLPRWLTENCDYPAVIKIDIEGHEEELIPSLRGAWPELCVLFLETHVERGLDDCLVSTLRQDGFSCDLLRVHRLPGDSRIFKEYMLAKGTVGMETNADLT